MADQVKSLQSIGTRSQQSIADTLLWQIPGDLAIPTKFILL